MSNQRRIMKTIYPLLPIVIAGCASGFDRGVIAQRLEGQRVVVNDAEVLRALQVRPQLRFPIKVAVFLEADSCASGSPHRTSGPSIPGWRWSVKDREQIASWAEPLKARGVIEDLYVVSDLVWTGGDLKSMRLAAAKHGADAVLVLKGVSQVDSYVNALSVLNLMILPGFFVPASHRDALLVLQGALWDVGNECLYLTAESEGEGKISRPTFRIKDQEAIEIAKEKALKDLGQGMIARLGSLGAQRD